MRELTFKGFLTQYVRSLSYQESNSLYKLAAEVEQNNVRLREPLLLYALYSQKQDVLLQATKEAALHEYYSFLLRQYDVDSMTQVLLEGADTLPEEYHKVWRSYQSKRNRSKADEHTKELMRQKVKRMQAQKGVTNYRIYTDLKLNHGNLNAWLKHGDGDKVSLETARKVVRYVECWVPSSKQGMSENEQIDRVAAEVLARFRPAFEASAE